MNILPLIIFCAFKLFYNEYLLTSQLKKNLDSKMQLS